MKKRKKVVRNLKETLGNDIHERNVLERDKIEKQEKNLEDSIMYGEEEKNFWGNIQKMREEEKKIHTEDVKKALNVYKKYKEGKSNLEKRVIANEDWWKLNHWGNFDNKNTNSNSAKTTSAWLFNSINNKHADFMDNFPSPNILAKESSDEETAKVLSSIIPVILNTCNFEQVYSDNCTEKLKNGPAIYGVYFNPRKNNGLGDIDIRLIDILNFFWEPGIQNIQDSKNIFVLSIVDNDTLKAQYPGLKEKLHSGNSIDKSEYNYDDNIDTSDKTVVYDWYYKIFNGQKDVLHYVKFVGDTVLYASENDENYKDIGYYAHGLYPFVIDVLFPEKGTPTGFGYIDIMKSPQEYIDKMNQAILHNAQWACRPRHFVRDSADINENEFADLSKDFIHVSGSASDLSQVVRGIDTIQLNGNYLNVLQMKIDELKETSGNRDFSQGTTTAGVTAASAIAALQEAGSKTSRDMIKASYRAFTQICNMIIELIRQFYDNPRVFRITGEDGKTQYTEFNNSAMQETETEYEFGIEIKGRIPHFDILVKAQKSSPYAREAQNELAIQLFQLGFFNPQISEQVLPCLEMMEFDGKEKVKDNILKNASMYQQMQQMQSTMAQMAEVIANTTGDTRLVEAIQSQSLQEPIESNRRIVEEKEPTVIEKAKDIANNAAAVK